MFEIPEYVTLARQMAESLSGKRIVNGTLGNSPHKFVWYNRKSDEFAAIVKGKFTGLAYCRGRWLFIPLRPGYLLVFGECGGRIILHESESQLPKKYHLSLHFDDGSFLSATTQMWGAMELYEEGKELERQHIIGMRTTPVDQKFSLAYLSALIEECANEGSRSVKGLLTQDQLIPGLGNSIAQDIMFKAKLHPKQSISGLSKAQIKNLHEAIVKTVAEVIRQGGRNDETDLYGNRGKYKRIMDKTAAGRPCPECGTIVEKMAYLGGACYYCPECQSIG
ncbi:MAG: DNA-formamidopyrimidine glycosylase family protein [Methanothrix sp.]